MHVTHFVGGGQRYHCLRGGRSVTFSPPGAGWTTGSSNSLLLLPEFRSEGVGFTLIIVTAFTHPDRCIFHATYLNLLSGTAPPSCSHDVPSGNEVTNRVLFGVTGLMRRGGFKFADNGG